MDFFYDAQVRRYLTQFMRVMSNFCYRDSRGNLVQIPVRYGDMNRQVSQILKKNSENTIPSAPFIACYIKDIQFDRNRLQDPTFVSKVHVREREYDPDTQSYLYVQGANYTVERIMPTPYKITFAADIWTTNLDQKLQFWEQLVVLFTPSLELQTTDNYIDWTSLSVLEIESSQFSSRSIPQGVNEEIDILNMTFSSPIWITPPAKVKKLGIITKIIANIHELATGTIEDNLNDPYAVEVFGDPDDKIIITPGNFSLLVLNNEAQLIGNGSQNDEIASGMIKNSWRQLLDLYPGKFRAGLSQLRLTKPNGLEITAYMSLHPTNESIMMLNFDIDTIPSNTIISGRGTIDAIIDPETFNPGSPATGTRYLILENINVNSENQDPGYDGPDAWKNSDNSDPVLYANDIIEWDGSAWQTIFDSSAATDVVYITNSYTGIQYKWSEGSWTKSFEGVYTNEFWRIIL